VIEHRRDRRTAHREERRRATRRRALTHAKPLVRGDTRGSGRAFGGVQQPTRCLERGRGVEETVEVLGGPRVRVQAEGGNE
jgi:hypothetical protein